MSLLHLTVLSLFLTIAIGASVFVVSCKKDKCKEVFCLNGGACDDGVCACGSWYEGTVCDTAMRAKFINGDATVIEDLCYTGSYLIHITEGATINQFLFVGLISKIIEAELTTSTHFIIPSQNFNNDSITVTGSGDYQNQDGSDVNIIVNYTIKQNWLSANDTFSCTAFIHTEY